MQYVTRGDGPCLLSSSRAQPFGRVSLVTVDNFIFEVTLDQRLDFSFVLRAQSRGSYERLSEDLRVGQRNTSSEPGPLADLGSRGNMNLWHDNMLQIPLFIF